ncbi:phage antirepressor KilAC domain-containing protein [Pseudomonas sp. Pseu.R1]|uniref:phage antirepressor KilAC domain-containing protein n=1 Tax=Pseudomonas sp. Pseu.R1 TaxID=3379818 RepID=UPI003B94D25D
MTKQQSFKTLTNAKFSTRVMFATNDGSSPSDETDDPSPLESTSEKGYQQKDHTLAVTAQNLSHYGALTLAASNLEAERASLAYELALLREKVKNDAEKVKFYEDVTNTTELYNAGVVAKTVGMGKYSFMRLLRELKILMPSGNSKNLPLQKYINAGHLDVRWVEVVNRQTGEWKPTPVPLFTGKGIIWIKKLIEKNARLAA